MKASERKRRRNEVSPAREVIGDLLQGYHIAGEIRRHRVVVEWPALVGARIAARTRPSPVQEDGVLWVRVSNSSWMHQLSFLRNDLLARINKQLGDPPLVTDLRLHIGRRPQREGEGLPPSAPRRRMPARLALPPPATGERLAAIESETACIEDEDLRAIVAEARKRLDL